MTEPLKNQFIKSKLRNLDTLHFSQKFKKHLPILFFSEIVTYFNVS